MPDNRLNLHLLLHPSGLQWAVAVGDKAGILSKRKCERHKSNGNNDTKNNIMEIEKRTRLSIHGLLAIPLLLALIVL
jgi:hypothetical protein